VARQEEGRAAVWRQVHSLFQLGACGDLTDGQLLEQFMAGHKESAEPAFTALVERHGPMVWRVCRRVLTDSHQAQDAFQATFLDSTVQSALGLGAGLSLTSSTSAAITLWTREVSKAMWMSKLRWGAIAVLTASAVGLGASFLWRQAEARQPLPPARNATSAPPNRNRDDNATWARHVGNLKRIGLALYNYHDALVHFPPAAITGKDGKPLLSWRVAILPYLVDYDSRPQDDLFKVFRLDEPWNSPHNKALLERMPAVFASSGGRSGQPFTTAYRGFVSPGGKQTAKMTPAEALYKTLAGKAEPDGPMVAEMTGKAEIQSPTRALTVFRENRGVFVAEITDGASNTLMVVEAAEAVPWTKPDDLPFSQNGRLPRLGGSMQGGFAALFASGVVRFLDRRFDERLLRCLITANGGEVLSTDELPRADAPPPGGLIPGQDAGPTAEYLVTDPHRYAGAATLENAVGILKDKLKREGKTEIADWLTEPKARRAIRAGLQTYETYLRRVGEPELPRRDFEIVKPIYKQLASAGTWPAYGWFTASSGVETRDLITYDRHQVRLDLEALDRGKPFRFSMLILDVFSGPVEEHSRPEELRDRQGEKGPQ